MQRALIVDPDRARAQTLYEELAAAGLEVELYSDDAPFADDGELLILAPMAAFSGHEARGVPYAVCDRDAFTSRQRIEPQVCVLRPFPWQFFRDNRHEITDSRLLPDQLLDMCGLSLLGDVSAASRFDGFVSGVKQAFRVSGCSLSTGRNAGTALASALTLSSDDRIRLSLTNRLAARAKITTLAALDEQRVVSVLSRPLNAAQWDGYLAPFEFGWRTFSANEADALARLSGRIEQEVALLRQFGGATSPTLTGALRPAAPSGPRPEPRRRASLTDRIVSRCFGGIYRVDHRISRGAMGTVYRGEDLSLHRPIAIKVLRAEHEHKETLVARLQEEARLLASVHHPNMVQVYALGLEDDTAYFVMEFVDGVAVANLIERATADKEWVDLEVVATVVEEVGDALDAIHGLGIIHRDVKPHNILLDRVNGRAVVVDVGIAKRISAAAEVAGTPGFTAPECFTEGQGSPATDVYGLAATTYAMLTGEPAFVGYDRADVLRMQQQAEPRPVTSYRPELSEAVDAVLTRALRPEPGERYASALAFSIAFGKAIQRSPR